MRNKHRLRFHSLQTGKHIATHTRALHEVFLTSSSFHSLQTGKHISTHEIPSAAHRHADRFPFPSNGKTYINPPTSDSVSWEEQEVSIPFKRESIYQLDVYETDRCTINGVSIPFKRESIYQRFSVHRVSAGRRVSIPFKRESIYQPTTCVRMRLIRLMVSIPFKRESIYQQKITLDNISDAQQGFHSLQTGKHISTEICSCPSRTRQCNQSFHSLQTGKHISTFLNFLPCRAEECFHSLQTGKHISTSFHQKGQRRWSMVSIPFKRESIYQREFRAT